MASRSKLDGVRIRPIGLKTSLHEDLYHRVLVTSWPLFFAGAALGFVTLNALFAGLYLLQPGSIAGGSGSFSDAFFFSVQTMGTIGYGVLSPATHYAQVIVTAQALTGMLVFAIMTGLTYGKFARPSSRVLFSDKAVIGHRDGKRHLMFRMSNARHNAIVEASLRVTLLEDFVSAEGEWLRVPRVLPLVRDTSDFFRLSWTALHVIDERSPFFGDGALEQLRKKNALLLLTLKGHDESLAQTIHARYSYEVDDLVVGARFADMLKNQPDGTLLVDYTKFHDIILEKEA